MRKGRWGLVDINELRTSIRIKLYVTDDYTIYFCGFESCNYIFFFKYHRRKILGTRIISPVYLDLLID